MILVCSFSMQSCHLTRALALYTQLAPLPAASLLNTQLRCLTRAQHFTRCSAALPVRSALPAALQLYPCAAPYS